MCLCVVVVVVSLFRLCHITRVYVGFFILTCYTLCLCPLSAECCVCVVVRGLICFFPSTVFIRVTPYPTDLRLREALPLKQTFLLLNFFYVCTHAQVEHTQWHSIGLKDGRNRTHICHI